MTDHPPAFILLVLDTNFLISNVEFLKSLYDQLPPLYFMMVPMVVVSELDKLKNRESKLANSARKASHFLEEKLLECSKLRGQRADQRLTNPPLNDDKIVDFCAYCKAHLCPTIILLTNDVLLSVKALVIGIVSFKSTLLSTPKQMLQDINAGQFLHRTDAKMVISEDEGHLKPVTRKLHKKEVGIPASKKLSQVILNTRRIPELLMEKLIKDNSVAMDIDYVLPTSSRLDLNLLLERLNDTLISCFYKALTILLAKESKLVDYLDGVKSFDYLLLIMQREWTSLQPYLPNTFKLQKLTNFRTQAQSMARGLRSARSIFTKADILKFIGDIGPILSSICAHSSLHEECRIAVGIMADVSQSLGNL